MPVNYYKTIMTKTLILVRHSKAESRDNSVNDFERSLTMEGKADSKKMATFLLVAGIKPDFIVTSSAVRALETATIFAEILTTPAEKLIPTRKLYYCSAKTILDQIYRLPETLDCILVVAHNPGISDLTRGLSSGRGFFMDNTQVTILEYNMEHWYQIDEQKPVTFISQKPLEIKN
ncbi:MAG: histidine phosphatase [Odoribacter sp.]|nr:histidine phosphatase [Odoribacter sp.]